MDECSPSCLLAPFANHLATGTASSQVICETVNQQDQARKLYRPIQPWQARLLELIGGNEREPLQANLLAVDIILHDGVVVHHEGRRVEYEALSYTWGLPYFSHSISINGHLYPITENLFYALLRIRDANANRFLWIDALCINQYDVSERSQQVAGMMSIYRKAKRVLVWLGEHGDHTAMCLRFFNHYSGGQDVDPPDQVYKSSCQAHIRLMLKGLDDLLTRPWYSRVWVRQEIWAAQDALVMCGHDSVWWSWLSHAAKLAKVFSDELECPSDDEYLSPYERPLRGLEPAKAVALAVVADARLLAHVWNSEILSNSRTDIVEVIQSSNHCGCTDGRDRIYGVLGMTTVASLSVLRANRHSSSDPNRPKDFKLPVDYTRSTCQIFTDLATWVITTQQTLSLLLLHGPFGGTVDGESLPSWCPNWNKPFALRRYTAMSRFYYRIKDEVRVDGVVLAFQAITVGRVGAMEVVYGENDTAALFASIEELPAVLANGDHLGLRDDCECEVVGAVSPGDLVLQTPQFPKPLIVRRRPDEAFTYQGWIDTTTRSARLAVNRWKEKMEEVETVYQDIKIV